MKTNFLPFLPLLMVVFVSCDPEHGINEVEVTLDTDAFDRISLASSSDVRIIQSDIFQVTLRGLQRDVDDVEVKVVNNRLSIDEHGNHPNDFLIKIFVPEIKELDCAGSSSIYGESNFHQERNMDITLSGSGELDFALFTDDLDLELSGSAYAYLEGSVKNLDAEITGSGWLRSFNLASDFADVRTVGSGSAEVNVTTDLDAFIIGSGDIFYKGHPHISAEINGSGKVIDAN
ncbi:MAG TPA: head GIN domain-containing protein [Saprospiraceae bacterium]|nr:head GIN domain-containing protein [Saprospiraceae bacterium]